MLRGDGMLLGAWDKYGTPPKFGKTVRELFGGQKVIGVTSSPAAELYQTVTASLRNPAGQFVAPTQDSLAAGGRHDPDRRATEHHGVRPDRHLGESSAHRVPTRRCRCTRR